MAYTTPNSKLIFAPKGNRYRHKRVLLRTVGADGSAVATKQVPFKPGRLIACAVDYTSEPNTTDILLKADTTDGVTIKTITSNNTDKGIFPLGTTAVDEGRAATAATDGFGGGFPIRSGVFIDIAQGDEQTTGDETVLIDLWVRQCTYLRMDLVSQSGADGSGAVTRFVDLHGPGTLAALAIDFQNVGATTDLVIKADATGGTTLFTGTSSNTDLAPSILGRPAEDEAVNVGAATDGTESANVFKRGLFFDLAQSDAFTTGNERVIVECWIDQ